MEVSHSAVLEVYYGRQLLMRRLCCRRCSHRLAAFRLHGWEDVAAAGAAEREGGDVPGAEWGQTRIDRL